MSLKGIDSKILLDKIIHTIKNSGYTIGNIDSTVCLQTPKIESYIRDMRKTLASVMKIDENNISVKATTTEKMGFVGTGEGISAYAVVLLRQENK
jgi:2-C-methyl-D-erythritol 2,4-cyclodiphosphate synthase